MWKEKFDKIIVDGGGFYPEAVKQFISDLRKKDMEELIKEVKRRWTTSDLELNMEQLIKDYYKE
jgi:hypothetical protein